MKAFLSFHPNIGLLSKSSLRCSLASSDFRLFVILEFFEFFFEFAKFVVSLFLSCSIRFQSFSSLSANHPYTVKIYHRNVQTILIHLPTGDHQLLFDRVDQRTVFC